VYYSVSLKCRNAGATAGYRPRRQPGSDTLLHGGARSRASRVSCVVATGESAGAGRSQPGLAESCQPSAEKNLQGGLCEGGPSGGAVTEPVGEPVPERFAVQRQRGPERGVPELDAPGRPVFPAQGLSRGCGARPTKSRQMRPIGGLAGRDPSLLIVECRGAECFGPPCGRCDRAVSGTEKCQDDCKQCTPDDESNRFRPSRMVSRTLVLAGDANVRTCYDPGPQTARRLVCR
jgi:hypothetical protein